MVALFILVFPKAVNLPALFFGGSSQWCGVPATQCLALLGFSFPLGNTVSGFAVEGCSFRGASPLIRKGYDLYRFFVPALTDLQGQTNGDFFTGFGSLALNMYLAAFDGGLGLCPGFKKPGDP